MIPEILGINLVEEGEVLHIGQVAGGLHHVLQREVGRLQDRNDVLQGLDGLSSQTVRHSASVRDEAQLTGEEDQPIGFDAWE